ncbi:MAG: helix-turn-helix transcriptional regulator [Anaerorhabdus sp.]|uniref:helix-turn-helix domain-containing protein n=1 Tax=Anaerorhabdus sp. TaxID=1872524 RepID=UPI002FC74A41
MTLGDKIKNLRIGKKYTQTFLAKELGITKAMISAYEKNTRKPSTNIILKLCDLFNVSLDYLLGKENDKYLNISSLTDNQIKIINSLITEFKNNNKKHNFTL